MTKPDYFIQIQEAADATTLRGLRIPHPLNQHRKAIRSAWFDNMITPRIQPLPTGRASSRAIRQSRTAQWSVGSGSPEQVRVWQRLVQLMRRKPGAPISKAELQQVPAEWRPGFLPARSTMRQRLTQALRKAGYHSPAKLSSSLPSRLAPAAQKNRTTPASQQGSSAKSKTVRSNHNSK